MVRQALVALVASSLLVCCNTAQDPVAQEAASATPSPTAVDPHAGHVHAANAPAADAQASGELHEVACACSLDKQCANLIKVENEFVPLEGDIGLGEMAFCGQTGLKAKVEGKLENGKFVATSFSLAK